MSTFDGEAYLDEQLASVFGQLGVRVSIIVRDDDSRDGTPEILDRWAREYSLKWAAGSNVGPAASFMQLVEQAPTSDYYAFADQDDSWDADKLAVAVERLKQVGDATPALYFSEKQVVDAQLRAVKAIEARPPRRSFGSSLILSAGSGCTMVFNAALMAALKQHAFVPLGMHDHWVYKVCSAIGGSVLYDPTPHLRYRQHGGNAVGAGESLRRRTADWLRKASSHDRVFAREAAELLAGYGDRMPASNREVAEMAANYRSSAAAKWRLLSDRRFRTGRPVSDVAFLVGVIVDAF